MREKDLIAPCGMNCKYCYVHHKRKNPCPGCRSTDALKPKSCKSCKIKKCSEEKNLHYCFECASYPCALINRLDQSYKKRYKESLIDNFNQINDKGFDWYLAREKKRFSCPECKGILNMHDRKCNRCGKVSEGI